MSTSRKPPAAAPAVTRERVSPATYDADYFERGPILGISGYMNYRWMPELTIRMAHKLVVELPIGPRESVLDFGCAKGFLVKALRILDIDASGVDVSEYAIAHADGEVRDACRHVRGTDDPAIFARDYDWMLAKDVFEHLLVDELKVLLQRAHDHVRKLFVAVPLAADDQCGTYIVPQYDQDVTHRLAKSMAWWTALFNQDGWRVVRVSHEFPGCKENWTRTWAKANGFFIVERR